jgi:hypothetical protein
MNRRTLARVCILLTLCGAVAFADAPEAGQVGAPKGAPGLTEGVPGAGLVDAAATGNAIKFLGALEIALGTGGGWGWRCWFGQLTTIETLRADKAQAILDERQRSGDREAAMRASNEAVLMAMRQDREAVANQLRADAARESQAQRAEAAQLRGIHEAEVRRLYGEMLTLSGRVADAVDRMEQGLRGRGQA